MIRNGCSLRHYGRKGKAHVRPMNLGRSRDCGCDFIHCAWRMWLVIDAAGSPCANMLYLLFSTYSTVSTACGLSRMLFAGYDPFGVQLGRTRLGTGKPPKFRTNPKKRARNTPWHRPRTPASSPALPGTDQPGRCGCRCKCRRGRWQVSKSRGLPELDCLPVIIR
jgi:hypothetical protein